MNTCTGKPQWNKGVCVWGGGVTRNKDNKAKQKHCSITEVIHTWCISKECYCDGGRFAPGGEKRMLGDAGLTYILGKHKILFLFFEGGGGLFVGLPNGVLALPLSGWLAFAS